MKVIIVTNGLFPVPSTKGGGAETLVQDILDQNEKFHSADFVVYSIYDQEAVIKSDSYKFSEFRFLAKKKWTIRDIPYLLKHFYLKKLCGYTIYRCIYDFDEVLKELESETFDFIVIENTLVPFEKFVNIYSNKVFVHVHNELFIPTLPQKQKELYGKLINRCAGVITVSNYIKNLSLQMNTSEISKYYVLLNSVNVRKYKNHLDLGLKYKYNMKNEFVFTYFGRVCEEKGVLEIINAFSRMKEKKIRLMVIGELEETDNTYIRKIKNLIVNDNRIIVTGYISHDELSKYLKLSNCAVLPSKCQDACPLTIIESMAAALPIITTRVGGIPEIVTEKNAIIIENDKNLEDNLYISMQKILHNDELRNSMSYNSDMIANVDGFYDLNSFFERFINILKGNKNE